MIRLEGRLFLLFVALLPLFLPVDFRILPAGPVLIAADFTFLAAVLAWLVGLARGRTTLRPSAFYLFAGLYLGAFALSVTASPDPVRSLLLLPREAYLVAIGVLTINIVRSWDDVKRVAQIWVASTAVVGLTGLAAVVLFYLGWRTQQINVALERFGSLPPGNYPRIRATFINANTMCTYMGVSLMILPLAQALGWIQTAWCRIVSAVAWTTALLSLSPGIGGLVLARGWWEWRRRTADAQARMAGRLALAAGIAAAMAFLAAVVVEPAPAGDRPYFVVMGRQVEPSSRVMLWGRAVQSIAARPVMGNGVGAEVEPLFYTAASGQRQRLTDPHNIWLSVGLQTGAIGLAAFVALVIYLWRCTRPSATDDSRLALSKLALRGAFISVVLYQGLSGAFENARHLWVLMGFMVAVGDERERLT